MSFRFEQFWKAFAPIDVTLVGMVMPKIKALQPWKAPSPMLVTLFGMVTFCKFSQSLNAQLSIVVTLLAIVTEVRPVQFLNALLPIEVTPSGTTYSVISSEVIEW